ncbi:MAG: hypothetical protein KBF88_04645 [Polyangiaceae bacterium]|nr:hypothetical protein [Polyangiaceae bacterium]
MNARLAYFSALILSFGAMVSFAFAAEPKNDRTVSEETIAVLGSGAGESALGREAARATQQRIQGWLVRADRFRSLGDHEHARNAEKAARAWSDRTALQIKLANTTTRVRELQSNTVDAGLQLDREKGLFEERTLEVERLKREVEVTEKELDEKLKQKPQKGTAAVTPTNSAATTKSSAQAKGAKK